MQCPPHGAVPAHGLRLACLSPQELTQLGTQILRVFGDTLTMREAARLMPCAAQICPATVSIPTCSAEVTHELYYFNTYKNGGNDNDSWLLVLSEEPTLRPVKSLSNINRHSVSASLQPLFLCYHF